MKKSLTTIALAMAAGAFPAHAQSSLTLYGTLDLGLLSINNNSGGIGYIPNPVNAGSAFKLSDGGIAQSFWGLRGSEDLGGGVSALFMLQGNLGTDTGSMGGPNSTATSSVFNQVAVVGLKGSFGEFKAGRQPTSVYTAMSSTDARQARYFGSVLTALVGLNSASGAFVGSSSNAAFGAVFNDNALNYTTPTWNNLSLTLNYALGETPGSTRANAQQTATLLYNANGLKLSALYYSGNGNNLGAATSLYTAALGSAAAANAAVAAAGITPTANTNRLTSLSALYNWGAFTVSSAYFAARNPANAVVKGGSASLDLWTLGGAWRVAPNVNLTAGYYRISDKTYAGNSARQLAVGVDYLLSARTILYAEYGATSNKGANMNLSPVYGNAVAANSDARAIMAGIRHSF